MALIWSQELILILLVFVLALFLIAFVIALLYGLWNRRRDSRLNSIEERLKAVEEKLLK
ncbi:MAG TPA: hypothetical protein VMC84_12930 [Methanocella sp.]|uniref:hypothetical protein n=1 Tax=Methanocella sp. TaxID=2052833 RepID=UPI002C6471EA|nr:hypothetical protein [Methanocella sp.]HTY92072.1 hypothetical protein [Methanocella sp.]